MSLAPGSELRAALDELAQRAAAFEFRLPGPEAPARRKLVGQVDELINGYLLGRLADLDGPAVAVVLGSTGSGKSTLVNSLAQASITRPGAVRPTTRRPVAWCHEHNVEYLRASSDALEVAVTRDDFVRRLTIIDAPDFDSVITEHREVVEELIAKSDFAIYVTTAQRYADGVPWDILRAIGARGIPLLPIINRLPTAADPLQPGPAGDFARLLDAEAVVTAEPVIEIAEQPVDALHGGLPPEAVEPVRRALDRVGTTADDVVLEATRGAVNQVVGLTQSILSEWQRESQELDRLAAVVERSYREQVAEFERDLRDGAMIRTEVLQRWNQQLGAGQLFTEVGEGLGRLRAWMRRVFGGEAPRVRAEAEDHVAEEIIRRAGLAARQVATAWDVDPAARSLLDERAWAPSETTRTMAHERIEDWLDAVTTLVRERGEGRRRVAQMASYGVNAVAVVALIAVFSQTAGITGAEVGITAGAAAVQQKLLEYFLGTAAARTLVTEARQHLIDAAGDVLAADAERFTLDAVRTGDPAALETARDLVRRRSGEFYG